jgi:hypothetical protein
MEDKLSITEVKISQNIFHQEILRIYYVYNDEYGEYVFYHDPDDLTGWRIKSEYHKDPNKELGKKLLNLWADGCVSI